MLKYININYKDNKLVFFFIYDIITHALGDRDMLNKELKTIKKLYGEDMMHLCRELFPTILEHSGVLLNILNSTIAPTKHIAKDIMENCSEHEFKNLIYSRFENNTLKKDDEKDPKKLLKSVGYTLYRCKNKRQVNSFKKYYAKGETLCTFNENRLKKCHVFFAVKDGADKLKRGDFVNPKRQDAYTVFKRRN